MANEKVRDFLISNFIVLLFVVFHKGFYVNPDASCRKEKREGKKKFFNDRNRYVYIAYAFDLPII
jgi:hypothetical protein